MSRDRRNEPQQAASGSSAPDALASIGKTTLIQALSCVPGPALLEGAGAAADGPAAGQRKPEQQADPSTGASKQLAVHDLASLFGRPLTGGGVPVQRAATSPIPASDAPAAPEIAARGVIGAGSSLPYLPQIQASFGHHDAIRTIPSPTKPGGDPEMIQEVRTMRKTGRY